MIEEEGLGLDVVSDGELYTAIKADFPSEKIQFHGNNKSSEELEMAIDYNVGTIIIDNFYEIELLENNFKKEKKTMNVLIRLTPGIESGTHRYIMTGNEDSKFGFNIQNGQADEAFKRLHQHPYIKLARHSYAHRFANLYDRKFYIGSEIVVCRT